MGASVGGFRGLQVRPLVIGTVLTIFGLKLTVDKVTEIRAWHQLAERRDAQTNGWVTSALVRLDSDSSSPQGYDVSYEFTAPGTGEDSVSSGGAAGSGSSVSAADIQADLAEQFWGASETATDEHSAVIGQPPESTVETPPEQTLPAGEQYFRGTQRINGDEYRELGIHQVTSGTVALRYSTENPDNSSLVVADNPPESSALIVPLLLILPGGWLIWQGLKRRVRSTYSSRSTG